MASGFISRPTSVSLSDLLSGDQRFSGSCSNVKKGCLVRLSTKDLSSGAKSVIFTREPMSRLVSAWKDKINRTEGRDFFYQKYSKEIIRSAYHVRPPKDAAHAVQQGLTISFKTFVQWLIKGQNVQLDEHWAPATSICSVCAFEVGFIGHIESFEKDIM